MLVTSPPPYAPLAPTLAGEITDASQEASAWAASTDYPVGATAALTGGAVLLATAAGTSGPSAPIAPAVLGGTVADGTVTWVLITAPTLAGEITPLDVQNYTNGRLQASDPETLRMLNAALIAARRDVGWHVSPIKTNDVMVLDGPGCYEHKLRIPTMNIVTLHSVIDRGVSLDVSLSSTAQVIQSAQVPWLLIRRHGHWSHRYADIQITLDHGFDVDQASDWRQAILSMVDQMVTVVAAGRPDADMQSKQIDDVVYRWGASQALPGAAPILAKYRLQWGWA